MSDPHVQDHGPDDSDSDSLEAGCPMIEPIKAANFPCWLMRIISTVVRAEVDRRMEPLGLTQAQWIPVLRLASGEAQTAADLARSTMQTPGAMTRLVDRLVEKGIIERERCTDDRRVVRLRLTEGSKGRGLPCWVRWDAAAATSCLWGYRAGWRAH